MDGTSRAIHFFMKKIHFILLIAILLGSATFFIATTRINKSVTVWKTYYSKEFKFFVDYPETLNPVDLHSESEVGFYDTARTTSPIRIHVSPTPPDVDFSKYPPGWRSISQTEDERHVVASVLHGGQIYTVVMDNFSQKDVQHILQSIKF